MKRFTKVDGANEIAARRKNADKIIDANKIRFKLTFEHPSNDGFQNVIFLH